MTTKPKARKFRIKRAAPSAGQADAGSIQPQPVKAVQRDAPVPKSSAKPAAPQSTAASGASSPEQVDSGNTIDAIRQEGLTGRQLRMARRVAQKHKLPATSDFDAVRLLRAKGIDPFQRSNMLELVVPQAGAEPHEGGAPDAFASQPASEGGAGAAKGRVQLPQTVPVKKQQLPSTEVSPADRRAQEMFNIQRDIARRRRRKTGLLLVRLAFFVMLPTFLAGYYFYAIATPMYATKSEFLIIQNEGSGGSGPLGGLLPTQFATNSDSIAVQGFLQSKDDHAGFDGVAQDCFKCEPRRQIHVNPIIQQVFVTLVAQHQTIIGVVEREAFVDAFDRVDKPLPCGGDLTQIAFFNLDRSIPETDKGFSH